MEEEETTAEEAILSSSSGGRGSGVVSSNLTTGHADPSQRWLLALHDPLAGLYTFSSCICFADLFNDGDTKLAIADLGTSAQNVKLNIYKGTMMQTQLALVDLPSAVVSFFMDGGDAGHSPALAVAAGNFLYIYKKLKPFYKFQLPPLPLNQSEVDAWTQVREEKIDVDTFCDILRSLQKQPGEVPLTPKSGLFLSLTDRNQMEEFVQDNKDIPMKRQTIITCVATLKRSVTDDDAITCLVIGTENRDVLFIEPDAFTILATAALPSVPVFMEVSGLFTVDFKLLVSCRDACVYSVKRGFKTAKFAIQLLSQPVGMVLVNGNIVIGCMDKTLSSYSSKGVRQWTLQLPGHITAVAPIEVEMLGNKLVAVALTTKQVLIYHDKHKVDCIETHDIVNSMKYGKYGRESGTLVLVSRTGCLTIRILKRTVKFYPKEAASSQAVVNKLVLPKKTKLFVDQMMRERSESQSMYRTFQQDMYRLKLLAARSYVKAVTTSMNPISANGSESLKLSAQVHGLGPVFRLVLELQNNSTGKALINLFFAFHCDDQVYDIETNNIPVPYLAPGHPYSFSTKVRCVSAMNVADTIKVFLVKDGESVPTLTAMINMPASEALL